jgi:hypothetical protein
VELKKSVDAVLLESGIGGGAGMLGLEWFSRWTGFKWCLLFSVLSALVYGIAGLACAVGVWFRSKLAPFSHMFRSMKTINAHFTISLA